MDVARSSACVVLTAQNGRQVDDSPLSAGWQFHEVAHQGGGILPGHKAVEIVINGLRFAAALRGRVLEKPSRCDAQRLRNLLQPRSTHTVCTLLILLNLLECDPELATEHFLGHADHPAPQPDTCAHVAVYGARRFRRQPLGHDLSSKTECHVAQRFERTSCFLAALWRVPTPRRKDGERISPPTSARSPSTPPHGTVIGRAWTLPLILTAHGLIA